LPYSTECSKLVGNVIRIFSFYTVFVLVISSSHSLMR